MTNPHEALARQKKAAAIVSQIWRTLTPEDRVSDALPAAVERMERSTRDAWARHAGQTVPSEATWALVVADLRERIADERGRPLCGALYYGPRQTVECVLGRGHSGAHDSGRWCWTDQQRAS